MCGIFGNLRSRQTDLDRSRDALQTLTHRGPDQWGEWYDDHAYLGHRRLSILDLSERGRQPMKDQHGDVIIAVNGEIYNYPVLRRELESEYSFASNSDSEIVLHGYRAWGFDGLMKRIDGMYAISLYDATKGLLYLARDRSGIKPVFFGEHHGVFAWSSELKGLTHLYGRETLSTDYTGVYDYLTYGYIPTPKTLYKNIQKLPPAHYLEYDIAGNRYQTHCYWTLSTETIDIDVPDAAKECVRLIDESVAEQMMSDVPLGVFLSGGMDSSAIAASAVRRSEHVKTFSIGFDVADYDESKYAAMVADHLGTDHSHKPCGVEDAEEWLGCVEKWYDEPFADSSMVPTHMVSRFCRENITVALSGDGGDEIFGGYSWYHAMLSRSGTNRTLAAALRPMVETFGKAGKRNLVTRAFRRLGFEKVWDELEYYTIMMGGLLKHDKQQFASMWGIDNSYDDYWYFRKYYREDLPLLTRLQYIDFHTYMNDDILTKVDRASMQVALEVRVPLLSKSLIEFAFSLPEPVRYYQDCLKGLFRHALRDRLPEEIIARAKKGFSIPHKAWGLTHSGQQQSMQEELLKQSFPHLLKGKNQ